jgi:hypothetical protein
MKKNSKAKCWRFQILSHSFFKSIILLFFCDFFISARGLSARLEWNNNDIYFGSDLRLCQTEKNLRLWIERLSFCIYSLLHSVHFRSTKRNSILFYTSKKKSQWISRSEVECGINSYRMFFKLQRNAKINFIE